VLVDGQTRVPVEVRTVSHDDESLHESPLVPGVQPDSTNPERLAEGQSRISAGQHFSENKKLTC
jgi:hypothetical protein